MGRFNDYLFIILFLTVIGLTAWITTRYNVESDWTHSGRNSLSEASTALLDTMEGEIQITAYVREEEALRRQIEGFIARYLRARSDIKFRFSNPDLDPQQMRELNIGNGALLIGYQGREEKLQRLTEQSLTNALQRLARSGERWIAYLEGHGERSLSGAANHDLGRFGAELERKGFKLQPLSLAKGNAIPDNTSVVVLAGPRVALLPGELLQIEQFLQRGGNLLWLTDPDAPEGIEPLAESLGIETLPGTLVDSNSAQLGIDNPAVVVIPDYPFHPVTQGLTTLSIFPFATPLLFEETNEWQAQPLLTTLPGTWNETSELAGKIQPDAEAGEREGPLDIALALTRSSGGEGEESDSSSEQRVVVIGDGDFLSNNYLGNGGNLDLGLAIIEWLSHDDALISIPGRTAPDTQLNLSQTSMVVIGFGFLLLIPALLLGSGVVIWLKRRRR